MSNAQQDPDRELLLAKNQLLEAENERLHKRLAELVGEIAALKGETGPEQLTLELRNLQEQLQGLQKRIFGDSSEKRPREGNGSKEKPPQSGHGPTPQPRLPVQPVLVELAQDDRVCNECGGTLEALRGITEDSDVVAVVTRQFLVEHLMRQKYRCSCGVGFRTAATNRPLIPGGRYAVEVAAHVAVEKYLDHMPLDRQRRSMNRQGLCVTTQTLWDQLDALARYHEPSYDELRQYVLGADVVGIDETWWRLMEKKGDKRWWVWAMTAPDAVWYGIAPSRSAKTAREMVGDFAGTLVCDGYKAYETLAKESDSIRLALCWSHARRKFVEAEPHHSVCAQAIELIGQLFAIDRDSPNPNRLAGDEKLLAADLRQRLRSEGGPPILAALREWALTQRGLPKSGLRRAIDYLLGHWKPLTVFLEDPYVPLDNNQTERELRGVVVGRKNHYGSRSERGTRVAAILYSLIETARINGLDPYQYLVDSTYLIKAKPEARPLPLAPL